MHCLSILSFIPADCFSKKFTNVVVKLIPNDPKLRADASYQRITKKLFLHRIWRPAFGVCNKPISPAVGAEEEVIVCLD